MSPKSSLGQNFLKSTGIVEKIIRFARVGRDDTILEIGPGTGMLTARLAEEACRVVAVEKDDRLFERLQEKFGGAPNVDFIHGDILDMDFSDLIDRGMKVVANLPYNIATQIILHLAEVSDLLISVTVMVQKEVAERICACVGQKDYSALTVILAAVFDASPGFVVGAKNFHPEPKVDSQMIQLTPKQKPLDKAEFGEFKRLVFSAFGQRRKMLRNSLLTLPEITKELLPEIESISGISLTKRPQELSWEDFALLGRICHRFVIL